MKRRKHITFPVYLSDSTHSAKETRREASNGGLFGVQKSLSWEGAEAKKRMFNLASRHHIENKETLEEQTGTKLKIKPKTCCNWLNIK